MKLSIVTINYNDAKGLEKTLKSVACQHIPDGFELEHIIIDGASTDGSVDVIKGYESKIINHQSSIQLKWVSEPDKGIYNAMNIGMQKATGDFVQILNAGDVFASDTVVERMMQAWEEKDRSDFIYGNMIKMDYATGKVVGKSGEVPYSLLNYFTSTLNHDCCWIRRTLFVGDNVSDSVRESESYGLYDEDLKIVSDWKWFLLAIGLGKVKPVYVDIDMTIFDTTGISERNLVLRNEERRKVLEEVLPPAVLADYDKHAMDMRQMDNLRKHLWAYKLVWTLERILNRIDNKNFKKPKK